ncbi:MAG: serine/threonine-protein kinase [Chloroflexota bacterium]|jgi:outer membrane protein assembly factor BamB/tRNA A-37 threonylcarbamoyl transferase component Bud32|nr:serine/threonine-protein kinase [Aggregatilineaceae bacterium]
MVDTQRFTGRFPEQPSGDSALQVGSILQNRYRITGVIGVGGMGSVYQARDLRFPNVVRYVAVKEMLNPHADQGARELTLRTFERESDMLASLSHPAVPGIYDYFPSKMRAYLVMEYINGRDLDAIVNASSERLPVALVQQWAVELCDVLGYLHRQEPEPIIFRDVKPSNIMIDQHGRLRLVDFGIAKIFQQGQKGTMIGTEGYSAPEQYRGEATPASDVYGIGATLHHLLTGRDPRLEAPFTFAERPIRESNPDVSPEFEAIIMKALSFDAADRYPHATAMKEALEQITEVGESSVIAPGARLTDEMSAWDEADRGVAALWKFCCEDEVRSSPVVHRGVVYVGAYDNNLYAINAADGTFRWKYPSAEGISSSPTVADAENLVLFGSLDHLLYAVDTRVGQLSWTVATQGAVQSSPAIAHGHVFFGSDDGHLYAVRLATGRVQWKWWGGAAIRSRPLVTGEMIVVGLESGDVAGIDLSGQMVWRFKAKRAVVSSPLEHDGLVFFGSMDWHVYALELARGWKVWTFRTNKPVVSSPAYGDEKIYIGSVDGSLYALDVATGKERWRYETGGQVTSSPAYDNGVVFFGSIDGHVYSLETKSGRLRWSFETSGPVVASPALHDGVVYIGSMDHCVYALKA